MSQPIICLMGPTASGKTNLAVQLATELPVALISVDSALIYRQMDIGTAKPSPELLAQCPHHLVNILEPNQSYSAAEFCRDAQTAIIQIQQQQKTPLLVGGTMLYFKALQQGLAILPAANNDIRHQLAAEITAAGIDSLYKKLMIVDPLTAQRIKPQDSQRIQRALEVYLLTGKPLSQHFSEANPAEKKYNFINIGLMPHNRHRLHEQIAQRFEIMLQHGLIEEVKKLYARGDLNLNLPAMRTVGYRQVWQYLEGEYDYQTMSHRAVAATRQLAKRQMTWLRSWPEITIFDAFDDKLLEKIVRYLRGEAKVV